MNLEEARELYRKDPNIDFKEPLTLTINLGNYATSILVQALEKYKDDDMYLTENPDKIIEEALSECSDYFLYD